MEYYDLSPYGYRPFPIAMLAVGWLGPESGVPDAGGRRLSDQDVARLRAASWNFGSITLGTQECDFCPEGERFLGNGEFRYYTKSETVFSAPFMMLHYVDEHGYVPPLRFVEEIVRPGELAWDRRADRLAEVVANEAEELTFRVEAAVDMANWRTDRALDVLRRATQDELLGEIAGQELGHAIAHFASCDFAGDLLAEEFSTEVQQGILDVLIGPR